MEYDEKTSIKLYLSIHKAIEYVEKTSIKLFLSIHKAIEYVEKTSIKLYLSMHKAIILQQLKSEILQIDQIENGCNPFCDETFQREI